MVSSVIASLFLICTMLALRDKFFGGSILVAHLPQNVQGEVAVLDAQLLVVLS